MGPRGHWEGGGRGTWERTWVGGGASQCRPAYLVVVRGPFLHVLEPKRADNGLVANELGTSFAQRLAREIGVEQVLHQRQTGGRIKVREVDGQLLQEARGELQGLRNLLGEDGLLVAGVVDRPSRQLLALRRNAYDGVDVLLESAQLHHCDAPHVGAVDRRASGLDAKGVLSARLRLDELVEGVGVEGAAARGAHDVHGLVDVDILLDLARPVGAPSSCVPPSPPPSFPPRAHHRPPRPPRLWRALATGDRQQVARILADERTRTQPGTHLPPPLRPPPLPPPPAPSAPPPRSARHASAPAGWRQQIAGISRGISPRSPRHQGRRIPQPPPPPLHLPELRSGRAATRGGGRSG